MKEENFWHEEEHKDHQVVQEARKEAIEMMAKAEATTVTKPYVPMDKPEAKATTPA
jgi:hypothetical protein